MSTGRREGATMSGAPRPDDPRLAPVQRALRLDDRLDDLRRVRIWSQLDRALDDEDDRPTTMARSAAWTRRWLAVALCAAGLLVAIGAALWVLMARGGDGPVRGGGDPSRGGSAERGGADGGGRARGQETELPAQMIEVPGGDTARAQLGAASITLHGPARLAVAEAQREVDVTLEQGRLAGDYDHARGGKMRVRTPHALVEIVGTVFAVEVTDRTCVAVSEGVVWVVTPGTLGRELRAPASWCTVAESGVKTATGTATETATGTATGTDTATGTGTATATGTDTATGTGTATGTEPVDNKTALRTVPRRPHAPASLPASGADLRDASSIDRGAGDPPPIVAPTAEVESAAPVPAPDAELYRQAEKAMRYGDVALADALLARLVVDHPRSDLIDEALFERARLAYQRGAWTAARHSLDQLLDGGKTPLREPARFLACRIAVRTADRDAGRCLDDLRRTTPDERLAIEALELRIDVAAGDGGCAAVRALLAELATAAPTRPSVASWRRRCPQEPP